MTQERSFSQEQLPLSIRRITIAEPHGPCGGVNAAVRFTDKLLRVVDGREPVYTFNEVVHNHKTNRRFEERGLVVIRDRLPDGERDYTKLPKISLYLSSAHGYKESDIKAALDRGCIVFITECPLVTKEKKKTIKAVKDNKEVVYFGKEGHPESRAVSSVATAESFHLITSASDIEKITIDPAKEYVFLNQTTMSQKDIRALKDKALDMIPFVNIGTKEDGCYATDNRQEAAAALMHYADGLLVVGSGDISNNTANLAKVGSNVLKPTYIINGVEEINWLSFQKGSGIEDLVLTSGASCDEEDFLEVIDFFEKRGVEVIYQEPLVIENEAEFPIEATKNLKLLEERYRNWPALKK